MHLRGAQAVALDLGLSLHAWDERIVSQINLLAILVVLVDRLPPLAPGVRWYSAPANSIRNGLAMLEVYQAPGRFSHPRGSIRLDAIGP